MTERVEGAGEFGAGQLKLARALSLEHNSSRRQETQVGTHDAKPGLWAPCVWAALEETLPGSSISGEAMGVLCDFVSDMLERILEGARGGSWRGRADKAERKEEEEVEEEGGCESQGWMERAVALVLPAGLQARARAAIREAVVLEQTLLPAQSHDSSQSSARGRRERGHGHDCCLGYLCCPGLSHTSCPGGRAGALGRRVDWRRGRRAGDVQACL
eukprot:3661971-Rhodomonas_salina.2